MQTSLREIKFEKTVCFPFVKRSAFILPLKSN